MRIGIYDPYLDDLGGGEKYMMTIALCLSKNHNVTVFWDNKKDIDELKERFLLDTSLINIAKNIFSSNVGLLKRLRETKKFDVMIVLSDGSIPITVSKKLFLHIQQPLEHISKTSLKTKLKLKRVDKIFCNSYFTKSFIDNSFNVSTCVIYPPVELYPEKVKKENIILNVGRLRVRDVTIGGTPIGDYKKQSVLVDVFKRMVKNGLKNWNFVLAVSVKDEDKEAFKAIQEKAKEYPIEFLVNKNNKQLWEIYNKASVYWHASGFGEDLNTHPEYAEHFGISTVEAMGAGAVPVVINAGGQKEIVEDSKNGFLWNTLEELEEKTLQLVKNKDLREKISSAAIERAKFFTGDRFCREVMRLIES